jgi:hypothetical protein
LIFFLPPSQLSRALWQTKKHSEGNHLSLECRALRTEETLRVSSNLILRR